MSDESTLDDTDRVLADCLEDYHRRRALGERPQPRDYAERAGDRLPDLVRIVETEEQVDAAMGEAAPKAGFPRPFGEYTLVRELGRGAMGVVYEAVHRTLGRTVAVKVLRAGLDDDPIALERFRREARACAMVRHPNIVEVHDAGKVDDQAFYSMALLAGRPLSSLAEAKRLPPLDVLARGFASIADALATLHKAGIVHRDVKPSNIVMLDDCTMVLADFGLARTAQSERVTSTGQALGTPLYMSPEQILGRAAEIDGRSDVYGLGAAMYEVFVGRKMFETEDVATALRAVLRERPASARSLRADLPEALDRIVMKCVEKRKEDRYQDAAALRDDLLNYAEGRKVVGRPVSDVEHGVRKVRRLWPAIAASVVAAAAASWWWMHRDATLSVSCWPTAQVSIDGAARGDTPITAKLSAGRHQLTLTQAGFAPQTRDLDLDPGADKELQLVLIAQAGDDPVALARLGKELEVAMASLEPVASLRGGDDVPVRLLWPRGEVRMEDLSAWRIDVSEDFEGGGRIEWRRGKEVVAQQPFDPAKLSTEGAVPAEALAGLKAGDRVTFAFVPDKGTPVTADAVISGKDLRPRFAKIAERTKEQPVAVGGHLRAQVLLDAGLPLAAYRQAKTLADAHPADVRAWVVMQHALDRLQLRDSGPWREAAEGAAKAKDRRDKDKVTGRDDDKRAPKGGGPGRR
jgi:serine/threonine protein kinase